MSMSNEEHGDVAHSDVSSNSRTSRRRMLSALSGIGIGSVVFQRALADESTKSAALTLEQVKSAEWVAGIELTDEQRTTLLKDLEEVRSDGEAIRKLPRRYETLPAFRFDPEMVDPLSSIRSSSPRTWLVDDTTPPVGEKNDKDSSAETSELSWLSIRELGRRLRSKAITAVQLAEHCLKRLEQADPKLHCVVNLTRELALRQAEQADRELAAGVDRGPLHGIPWGAKDLVAVSGYPTTWGAPQFREQSFEDSATVFNRLEKAGAVLVAKLSLGALAMGDQWYGGQTRNPWNIEQGSSGSSAGSASAVAAGLVPFAIGSETLGSIISPTRRCGVVGLRPTFGRVSRAGCMALSWTMDKIGPIARSADDCGFVLNAIHGRDDADPTTVNRWFGWPKSVDLKALRIGRVTNSKTSDAEQKVLDILTELGVTLVDIELPRQFSEWTLTSMLDVEAAAVFETLTRTGETEGLNSWPKIFQRSHFVSAVDFLLASQSRYLLMQEMVRVFEKVDLYVGGSDLGITNLTGHPMIGFPVLMQNAEPQSRPVCSTMTAGLFDETTLLSVTGLIEMKADVLKHRPTF